MCRRPYRHLSLSSHALTWYSLFTSPPNLFNCHQRQKSCIAVLFSSVLRDLPTQYTKSTVTISLFFSLQIYYIIQSLNATLLHISYHFISSLIPLLSINPLITDTHPKNNSSRLCIYAITVTEQTPLAPSSTLSTTIRRTTSHL